jgi:hypothetical protein
MLAGATTDVVACTHGDIVSTIIERLWRSGMARDPDWAKGSTWVLTIEAGIIRGARYVPPG